MKRVSLVEVNIKIQDFLDGNLSREEVSSWALKMQNAQDLKILEYVPKEDENIIWESIQFLVGIDLKCSPNEYLHSLRDIENFRFKITKI